MIGTELIETKKGAALGVKITLCETPLLLIRGEKGYLACAYFDSKTVEKAGDCCAIIPGVKSFSDMLKKRVQFASKKAQKIGVKRGMTGARALDKLI
jgi:uncharacterized protein YunC (DUF1805 family)